MTGGEVCQLRGRGRRLAEGLVEGWVVRPARTRAALARLIGARPLAGAETRCPVDEAPARLGALAMGTLAIGTFIIGYCDQSRGHDPERDRDNGHGSLPAGNRGRTLRRHSTYPIEGRQTGFGYMRACRSGRRACRSGRRGRHPGRRAWRPAGELGGPAGWFTVGVWAVVSMSSTSTAGPRSPARSGLPPRGVKAR